MLFNNDRRDRDPSRPAARGCTACAAALRIQCHVLQRREARAHRTLARSLSRLRRQWCSAVMIVEHDGDGDGDGDGDASWADPLWWTHHSGRFELRAQLTHSSQRSDCSRWTERALISFREGEDRRHSLLALLRRITLLVLASSFWSLMPILCPFGDPYDLSLRGFALNSGYFLAYSGLGWGSLWMTNAMWTVRILGLSRLRAARTVVLPTVAAVALCEQLH